MSMRRYLYAHVRGGYGYEPGDVVTAQFARQYPYLVRPADETADIEEPDRTPERSAHPGTIEDGDQ